MQIKKVNQKRSCGFDSTRGYFLYFALKTKEIKKYVKFKFLSDNKLHLKSLEKRTPISKLIELPPRRYIKIFQNISH